MHILRCVRSMSLFLPEGKKLRLVAYVRLIDGLLTCNNRTPITDFTSQVIPCMYDLYLMAHALQGALPPMPPARDYRPLTPILLA